MSHLKSCCLYVRAQQQKRSTAVELPLLTLRCSRLDCFQLAAASTLLLLTPTTAHLDPCFPLLLAAAATLDCYGSHRAAHQPAPLLHDSFLPLDQTV